MWQDLRQSLARARQSLRLKRRTRSELENTLTGPGADVEMLESLSLRGLFLTFLGKRKEQLERRRQDLLAAELRYEECKEAIVALEEEVAELEDHVERLGNVQYRYQTLLDQKKQVLLHTDRGDAKRILELSEALADVRSDLRELEEAIRADDAVVSSLDGAISSLKGGRNWGTVDILGGGLFTTAVKHGGVDEARGWVHRAHQHLRRFRRELVDLGLAEGLDIDIGTFATFADYFFDGLIADWVVQRRINRSLDRAVDMRRSVQAALAALRGKRTQVEQEMKRLREEKEKLIAHA